MPCRLSVWRGMVTVAVLAALVQCPGARDARGELKGPTMRIALQQFSFEVPQGFEDWTNYTFKERAQTQVLTVSRGKRPREASDLRALLASRRAELERLVPGPLTMEAEVEGVIAQWPARLLVFSFVDRQTRFREQWAVAFDTPQTYVQISYATPAEDAAAAARFAHILRSVTPSGAPDRLEAPAGFVRRWAGICFLDVPEQLAPPRSYLFSTVDEKTQLVLTVYDLQDPARPEPSLEQEVVEDAQRGTVSEQTLASFAIGASQGRFLTYIVEAETPEGQVRDTCRRALVQLGDRVRMHLYGRAQAADADWLEQIMTAWIRTFELTR
jgi:hypothetical protein